MIRNTIAPLLLLLGGLSALAADPAPADKQAFAGQPTMYLLYEITHGGTREFGVGTPADAVTDGAHRFTRSAKFAVPLNMPMPGTPPVSSMASLSPAEMAEEGRFAAWIAMPDDAAIEQQLTTGVVDLAKSPMFLPVEFSIDDVHQHRYRDQPSSGWGTNTTTSKGRGIAYIPRSGMLMCDLKKMICDVNNVVTNYNEGTDLVTVTTTSDVPGFEAKKEMQSPDLLIPTIPEGMANQFAGFPITLPAPTSRTFSGPASGEPDGSIVTVKLTLSSRP